MPINFTFLGQDQSTMVQRAETIVDECSLMSCTWACFPHWYIYRTGKDSSNLHTFGLVPWTVLPAQLVGPPARRNKELLHLNIQHRISLDILSKSEAHKQRTKGRLFLHPPKKKKKKSKMRPQILPWYMTTYAAVLRSHFTGSNTIGSCATYGQGARLLQAKFQMWMCKDK